MLTWTRTSVAGVLVASLLVACAADSKSDSQGVPTGESTEKVPSGFWQSPINDGIAIPTESAALLPYVPRIPDDALGVPERIVTTNPASAPPALREIAWVYQHSTFGTFVIRERIASGSGARAEMEEMSTQAPGCSTGPAREEFGPGATEDACFYGERSLIEIGPGVQALLYVGESTTFVRWVEPLKGVLDPEIERFVDEFPEPALLIEVIGPSGEFTAEEAAAVALEV